MPSSTPSMDADKNLHKTHAVAQHSTGKSIALHLLPGIPITLGFIIVAAIFRDLGYPTMFALAVTVGLVEVPLLAGLLYYFGKKENNGRFSWKALFPYRTPVPIWQYFAIGIPVIIWSMATNAGLNTAIHGGIIDNLFSWWPKWLILDFTPEAFKQLTEGSRLTFWIVSFFTMATLGSWLQELYFRSYLLPRMEKMGGKAPVVNTVLFSIFHFTSPWDNLGRILGILPWSYFAYRKKSMNIAVVFHVGMALLGWIGMTFMVFGLVRAGAN